MKQFVILVGCTSFIAFCSFAPTSIETYSGISKIVNGSQTTYKTFNLYVSYDKDTNQFGGHVLTGTALGTQIDLTEDQAEKLYRNFAQQFLRAKRTHPQLMQ